MRRSNEHANASRKAYFPLGREQRIESGDTAFSYNRNIHTTQDRGLLLRSLVPGKISEVVCFIDGACGREDEIRRFFKELLCPLVECLAASSNAIKIREHNGIGIRPGYRCGTPFAITLVKDIKTNWPASNHESLQSYFHFPSHLFMRLLWKTVSPEWLQPKRN